MKRIILLRHGQSAWNNAGRFQGATDIELDDTGREQADRAAKVLAATAPDVLYSSGLRRALDTAAPIADLTGLTAQVDPRLRERSFGPWEGLTRVEVRARFGDAFAAWEAGRPVGLDGIEAQADVAARGRAVLERIAGDPAADGTAIAVSHSGALRQALGAFLGWTPVQSDSLSGLGNCCWADLRLGRAGWRLHGYNLSAA